MIRFLSGFRSESIIKSEKNFMKEVIKNILDEYAKYSFQINFNSEAARYALAEHIEEGIKKWQKENQKKNED